jgi:hypothetical protein
MRDNSINKIFPFFGMPLKGKFAFNGMPKKRGFGYSGKKKCPDELRHAPKPGF